MSTNNLGHVTAYAYAKSKGYTGTEAQFAQLMADFAGAANTAVEAAEDAEGYKNAAAVSASDASTAASNALSYRNSAETSALSAEQAAADVLMYKGSPMTAATVAEMTDTDHVYVYTGSEVGYTAGNWYYYNGASWVSGGAYNSAAVQTDTTLSVPGVAADSAAVGKLKNQVQDHNSVDLIPTFATYTNRTINGITFTYSADKKSCAANGTSTGVAYTDMTGGTLPSNMIPGHRYYVKAYSTSNNLYLSIQFLDNGTAIQTNTFVRDGIIDVPDDADGANIRIYVVTSKTVSNDVISFAIMNVDDNFELMEDIEQNAADLRNGVAQTISARRIISGSFNSSGGVSENAARIRTQGFIRTYAGERLDFKAGSNAQECLVGYFSTEKAYIKDSRWLVGEGSLDLDDGYIICVYRRLSHSANIAPSNYDAVTTITPKWKAAVDSDTLTRIPEHYTAYLPTKVDEINQISLGLSRQSGRFLFLTDYHDSANAGNSPALIKYLAKACGIKNLVLNGDYITSETSKLVAYNALSKFVGLFDSVPATKYFVTGNHEYNNPSIDPDYVDTRELSQNALFMLFNDPLKNAVCLTDTNSFYADDDNAKIRYYFIDCGRGALIAVNTIKRVLKSAESVPDGYAVMIFSHVGLKTDNTEIDARFADLMGGFAALNDGTTYTYEGQTFVYTDKARTVVGAITGHTHLEGYQIFDGRFPVIASPCDCYMAPQQVSHPERVAGTTLEQAFEVVQIDVGAKRIYLTRIGWGNSRTFSFGDDATQI